MTCIKYSVRVNLADVDKLYNSHCFSSFWSFDFYEVENCAVLLC